MRIALISTLDYYGDQDDNTYKIATNIEYIDIQSYDYNSWFTYCNSVYNLKLVIVADDQKELMHIVDYNKLNSIIETDKIKREKEQLKQLKQQETQKIKDNERKEKTKKAKEEKDRKEFERLSKKFAS